MSIVSLIKIRRKKCRVPKHPANHRGDIACEDKTLPCVDFIHCKILTLAMTGRAGFAKGSAVSVRMY